MKKTVGLDWDTLQPAKQAPNCKIPALFIRASMDTLIPLEHSKEVHEAYGGEKNMIICEGDHNSERPNDVLKKILEFFQKNLS